MRSPETSPRKIPGSPPQKSPGRSAQKSPSKSPKKSPGKSPKASPVRQNTQSQSQSQSPALSRQPVQLFQNPVPSLEPSLMPKRMEEKGKRQESPEREQSPVSVSSEPAHQAFGDSYTYPYALNSQFCPEQDFVSTPQRASQIVPMYVRDTNIMQSSVLQFGQVVVPQLQGGYSSLASFEAEWRESPEPFDSATASSAEGSEHSNNTTRQRHSMDEGNITAPLASLGIAATSSPEANITSERGDQAPRANPGPRRNTFSTRTKPKLSPIREISRQDTLSPDSSSAITTDPPSPARSIDSIQLFSTQKHPSSSISTQSSPSTTRTGVLAQKQKPEGFFWQLDSHGFTCASTTCDQRCNLWDGSSVICPKCGPYSEVRYCSKQHLLEDVKWHWPYCGQMGFEHPCREKSIPREVREGPLLVPCVHGYDTPERHRQAIWSNVCAGEGDYFIFSDWGDMLETGGSDGLAARCSSRVIHTVRFDDPDEKDRFHRVLAACLFCKTTTHPPT